MFLHKFGASLLRSMVSTCGSSRSVAGGQRISTLYNRYGSTTTRSVVLGVSEMPLNQQRRTPTSKMIGQRQTAATVRGMSLLGDVTAASHLRDKLILKARAVTSQTQR
jgi:hypothetical protein